MKIMRFDYPPRFLPTRQTRWFANTVRVLAGCCLLAAGRAEPAARAGEDAEFFEKFVRPIFAEHCAECHGERKQKGGLRLDSRAALLQGGESGPAIVPGDAEKSELVAAIRQLGDLKMPPKSRLDESEIARIAQWIQRGAPWPGSPDTAASEAKNTTASAPAAALPRWWAFEPLRPVAPPTVKDPRAVPHAIDRFLQHEFEARDLTPLGPATKRSLLRRATFDLTGLPPAPDEIAAFLSDDTPGAFARVVERLLASPHYGERWGRRWLDVARYTDYLKENKPSPEEYAEAFRYRDWVVSAFNDDLPYDRFIEAQLAGDLVPGTPLAATGALAIGVYDNGDSDKHKIVSDIVADQIDFVSKAFLGVTLACARCHDHKFDPFTQRDYYGLAGIFYSTRVLSGLGKPGQAVDFLRPALEGEAYAARYADAKKKLEGVVGQLKKVNAPAAAAVAGGPGADAPTPPPDLEKRAQQRKALTTQRDEIQRELDALPAPTCVMGVAEGGVPGSLFPKVQDVPVHVRGSHARLGALVPRGFPRVLAGENQAAIAQGSGRLELAHWLASAGNPLPARVMVNRIWQGHFGEGLVRSANNFGKHGDPPANAALLDWLAAEFIQSGWSVKAMHRLIMGSAAYQRAAWQSGASDALRAADPENRMLARFPTRRLEAEAIRDAMLAAADSLDPAMGGPAAPDVQSARRSLYVATTRKVRGDFSTLFDAADPEMSVEKREVSTVAPQALFFLNSPFVHARAAALAQRVLGESGDEAARIARAYERLYARPADARERQLGLDFLDHHGGRGTTAAWTAYAHLLLCANEFILLD